MSTENTGHRTRLRQKFLASSGTGMPDYEILELLLTLAQPRGDVKPLAKALLVRFGSLSGVLTAPADALKTIEGVGESAIATLRLGHVLAERTKREAIADKPILQDYPATLAYLFSRVASSDREEFHVLYLNSKNHLIGDETLFAGTINAAAVFPRELAKNALSRGATALVVAHNHPSGDPTPSNDDIILTQELKVICQSLGILLHDHVVLGDEGKYYSFRECKKI